MSILGLAELALTVPDPDYAAGFKQIFWSLCQFERHNNGGDG